MSRKIGLLFVCGLAAVVQPMMWAQTSDGSDVLKRIRENVMDTATRLPRYTCSLKIERAQYEAAPGKARDCDGLAAQQSRGQIGRLEETDRVRLDVAIGDANEIYSWVGEDRFDDRDVFDLVSAGALQNGGYLNFLAAIFGGDAADFTYDGEKVLEGRTLAEFRFRVPLDRSNYIFANRRRYSAITAYGGTVFADPKTGDLVRLVIHTSGLPEDSGACEASTTLDYSRMSLNDSQFLLPRQARLDILTTDASEFRNVTTYSSCHEFLGKSVVKFDESAAEPSNGAPAQTPSPPTFTLPVGGAFKLLFTQPIDTATAAAGDRIRAKLSVAIIDASSKRVLAPAGAEIVARIIRLEHFPVSPESVRMLVKLETISVGGTNLTFSPALNWVAQKPADLPLPEFSKGPRLYPVPPPHIASFDALSDPDVGTFYFRDASSNFVIRSGLESIWWASSRGVTTPSLLAGEMLAAHNAARLLVGVPPLVWSDRLAAVAQEWANTLLERNQFVHRPHPNLGENLFEIKGPDAHASPSQVVETWAAESHYYAYRSNTCVGVKRAENGTQPSVDCGHYTQVVWRTTKEVGCAVARSETREVWVCNYDPRGNWVGVRPY
jgi:pathogenesis-related protein 1